MVPQNYVSSNFNPHSREGSDQLDTNIILWKNISIHTPAKGATMYKITTTLCNLISIHTPAKGATRITVKHGLLMLNFNPHSREGSDLILYCKFIKVPYFNPHSREGSDHNRIVIHHTLMISIHTPAKGATIFYIG